MKPRWLLACVLSLVSLISLAFGARATALLDGVETALGDAAAALVGDTTKTGKKKLRAANNGLAKIDRDTTAEVEDVKLLKKIAGSVLKRFADDAVVTQAFVAAADAADASIEADIAATRGRIPAKKVTPTKVTKAADKAANLLAKSRIKPTTKARIAVLFKARKAADKADGLADKLGGGGGGLDFPVTSIYIAPNGGGTFRLHELEMDTGKTREVDTGAGEVSLDAPIPATSPDGGAVAIGQATDIVLVALDGTSAVTQTTPAADWEYSAWSPDSTRLAVCGLNPDTLVIFDRAGAVVHSLAEEVLRGTPRSETLLWSPDGAYLAYRTDRNADAVKELRILNVATGAIAEGTSDQLDIDQIRFVGWSAASDKLVYPADEDEQTKDVELVVVNKDGTGRIVVSAMGEDVRDSMSTSAVVTSPASAFVLYEFRSGGMGHLATVGLDGANHNVIATASANFFSRFVWAPDGSRIAFLDDGTLHSVAPDGSDDVVVSASCRDFQWSPRGLALIYREGPGGSFTNKIWVCDPDGRNPLNISPDSSMYNNVEPYYTSLESDDGVNVTYVASSLGRDPVAFDVLVVDDGAAKLKSALTDPIRILLGEAGKGTLSDVTSGAVVRYSVIEGRIRRDFGSVLTHISGPGSGFQLYTFVTEWDLLPNGELDPTSKPRATKGECRDIDAEEATLVKALANSE